MAMRVVIRHSTRYKFDRSVSLFSHTIRLRHAPRSRTPIEAYSLEVSPDTHFINWQLDPFSNYLARVVFPEQALELSIDVEVIARLEGYRKYKPPLCSIVDVPHPKSPHIYTI